MGICSSIQKNTFQTVTYENLSTTVEYSEADIEILESSNLKNIPFLVLQKATKKFHLNSRVSEDGTGCIFKGQIEDKSLNSSIPEMANKAILVKLFWDNNFITRKQFLTGIEFLTRFDHPNLVNLVGYCLDASHMLLVLEFMAHGSLQNHLFKRNSSIKPLLWNNRVKIALDAAKGLAYLHSDEINVIFRDFKSSNILLDENYNAKLYGLELARKGPEGDDDHVSTLVMGTYGYAAPEYIATGRLTTKCDVYAFGAFLIEMLTSCRYNKLIFKDGNYADWVKTCVEKKESLLKIIDVEIEGQYSIDEALKVADLAMECLSVEPSDRPNMSQVVGLLEQLLFNPIGTL